MYLDITNHNVNTRQKINAVQINFNPYGRETAAFQSTVYYMSQTLALQYFHSSHLCYKSIINYGLDITNSLIISPQIRYSEVFNITNPPFNEQIWPVPSDFVKSRFYCKGIQGNLQGESSTLSEVTQSFYPGTSSIVKLSTRQLTHRTSYKFTCLSTH